MIRWSVIFFAWLLFVGGSVAIESSVNAEETGSTELGNNGGQGAQEMTPEEFNGFIEQELVADLIVDCFDSSMKKHKMYYYVDKDVIYMNTTPHGKIIQHLCEEPSASARFILKEKNKGIQISGTVTEERKDAKKITTTIYKRYMRISSLIRGKIEERPVVFILTPNTFESWTTPQE